ncbi:MoaD/ThiS family protein [Salinibacter altiplanensis]|uniref:MoaD/ThiS family protein n=1 Tax=Salinibacter altiplanensis TaxID=1803181 RepID=UPI000C9EF52A|nr:MoaD/ThiS family protein [Salinibacter altiplanensis]
MSATTPDTKSSGPDATERTQSISVQYYAQLREDVGQSEEVVQTGAATVAELYDELDRRYDLSVPADNLRVAVNDDFADWETPLSPEDRVVFIPPVAGG